MSYRNQIFAWRKLAPAGNYATPETLLRVYLRINELNQATKGDYCQIARQELGVALREQCEIEQLLFYGSGTAALARVFQALKSTTTKKMVAVAAYTCPSIVTACLHAGFQVLPVDISPYTLELDLSTVATEHWDEIAAVVVSNLYGLPDSLEPFKRGKWLIVDDASQALFSRDENGFVGCRANTIGVTSFNRGKAICGLGGGAIILGAHSLRRDGTKDVYQKISASGEPEISSVKPSRRELLRALAYSFFEHPSRYWLPAALPFLSLGKTIVVDDINAAPMNALQYVSALAYFLKVGATNVSFLSHAQLWHELLQGLDVIEPFVTRGLDFSKKVRPLRYPLIMPSAQVRDRVLKALNAAGLGASASYPLPINEYPSFRDAQLIATNCPQAQAVAERIITLPLHRYVTLKDICQGAKIIRETIC